MVLHIAVSRKIVWEIGDCQQHLCRSIRQREFLGYEEFTIIRFIYGLEASTKTSLHTPGPPPSIYYLCIHCLSFCILVARSCPLWICLSHTRSHRQCWLGSPSPLHSLPCHMGWTKRRLEWGTPERMSRLTLANSFSPENSCVGSDRQQTCAMPQRLSAQKGFEPPVAVFARTTSDGGHCFAKDPHNTCDR